MNFRRTRKNGWEHQLDRTSLFFLISVFSFAAFLSPPTFIMPKGPQCRGNRCSVKKTLRTEEHNLRYHNPAPVSFESCWDGQLVKIERTGPLKEFHCAHPDCKSSTPLRSSCIAHHKSCKLLSTQHNGIKIEHTVSSAFSTVSPETAVAGSSSVPLSVHLDREVCSKGE